MDKVLIHVTIFNVDPNGNTIEIYEVVSKMKYVDGRTKS
jgi:hypothetical protein